MKLNLKRTIIIYFCCLLSALGITWFAPALGAVKLNNKIIGLTQPELKNAQARLKILQKYFQASLTPANLNLLLKKGATEIQKAIQPYGYFKSHITSKLKHHNHSWTAYYYVLPGPAIKITKLQISITGPGKHNRSLNKLLRKLPLKRGNIFNSETYSKARNTILHRAQQQGYLKAKFTKNIILIHLQPYTCVINIILNTGPRYYFGPFTFSPSPFADKFLQRYIDVTSKTPFSYNKLLELQQRLLGSDYFQNVTITAHQNHLQKYHIPAHVKLLMRKNKAYKFGFGYGTTTGMRGTIGFDWRWINCWGHKLKAYIKLSKIERNLVIQYLIPGKQPAREQYTVTTGIYEIRPHRGISYMQSVGLGYIRNYVKWQQTLSLSYQTEKYNLYSTKHLQRASMLVPNITFSHVTTTKLINVRNGNRFNFTLQGSYKGAFSNVSFIQAEVFDKWIYSFRKRNRIVLRGDVGYTWMHHQDFSNLPLSKQFYTGGIQSIRGFGYKYLGPGGYLIVGSAEYQLRLYKNIYGAIFYDAGNAMNDFKTKFERSTGIGVIWQSPIGALQVYVTKLLTRKTKNLGFEFSLGPDL